MTDLQYIDIFHRRSHALASIGVPGIIPLPRQSARIKAKLFQFARNGAPPDELIPKLESKWQGKPLVILAQAIGISWYFFIFLLPVYWSMEFAQQVLSKRGLVVLAKHQVPGKPWRGGRLHKICPW